MRIDTPNKKSASENLSNKHKYLKNDLLLLHHTMWATATSNAEFQEEVMKAVKELYIEGIKKN